MRALCEACDKPQPLDWKAGEQCVHCGAAVRRDVRCFWCAKGTPAGKFCRACGADLVDDPLYGAARMLKEAGTDRFTVPKLLKEFDAERIEHFTRLYQRHAALAARHVDDLRFLERFLFHRNWSEALEDGLIPRLPFPEAELKTLSVEPRPPADDLTVARSIQETSPFPRTRILAALARVRLDDWSAVKDAAGALRDPELAPEAVLVLSGWRVLVAEACPLGREREPVELLKASPFREEAAVRLGLLGHGDPGRLNAALDSKNPETAFAAALALGDPDRLRAALGRGDGLMTLAAGRALARQGVFAPLDPVLRAASLDVQADLVHELARQKKAAPELRGVLLDLVENVRWEQPEEVRRKVYVQADRLRQELRKRAVSVLARSCDAETALRLARASEGDTLFVQPLLADWSNVSAEGVEAVLGHLVSIGRFSHDQWNLDDAVKRGAVPPGFAPAHWPRATSEMRKELVGLSEKQLQHREDEGLHRFLMNVVFGPEGGTLRAQAWWALHRGYRRSDSRGEGPLSLEDGPIRRFFGSAEAFVPKLVAVLRDDVALREVGLYDFLGRFLKPVDPAFAARIAGPDLARALLGLAGGDYHNSLCESAVQLLGYIGCDPRWRDEVVAGLVALGKKGSYHHDRALRRLRLSVHGLPDESEWKGLGWRFAPDRFEQVAHEGRLELLRLVEHQRIHEQEESLPLCDWLIAIAFGSSEPDVRRQAMEIHGERSPNGHGQDLLTKPDFFHGIARALGEPEALAEGRVGDFIVELLRKPVPLPAGAGGLVQALLRAVGSPESVPDRVRRAALDFVARLGEDPVWRDVVVAGLSGLDDRSRSIAERLKPPPPPDREFPTPPVPAPPEAQAGDDVARDYAKAAQEAERLGRELQEACLKISLGSGTPDQKTKKIMRLQDEFQRRIKKLYGA